MPGIVSLLFCGITLKHYAYYNMSRRTQLTTKFIFQVLAQLSENFIFIYLGITVSSKGDLEFKPLFIIVTVVGVCAARYAAVFPLSKLINWVHRFRARRRGQDVADELPYSYQVMLFWAGLRGAVGVALAAGLQSSKNFQALQATVLVVVVLTVIIFGGTTARMLEIMGIRTGVVEEVDSDDEFDIETVANGSYYKRTGGTAFGHTPTRNDLSMPPPPKPDVNGGSGGSPWEDSYSSGSNRASPPAHPVALNGKRHNSTHSLRDRDRDGPANVALLNRDFPSADDDGWSDADLPPAAPRRSPKRRPSPPPEPHRAGSLPYPTSGSVNPAQLGPGDSHLTATGAIRDFFTGTEDHAAWFRRLDEAVIKPTLLLDQNSKGGAGNGSGQGGV